MLNFFFSLFTISKFSVSVPRGKDFLQREPRQSVWHFICIQKVWLCNPCPAEAALPGLHLCPSSFHVQKDPFVHPRAVTCSAPTSRNGTHKCVLCPEALICSLLRRRMFCCRWLRVMLMTPERILRSVNSQKFTLAKQRDKQESCVLTPEEVLNLP